VGRLVRRYLAEAELESPGSMAAREEARLAGAGPFPPGEEIDQGRWSELKVPDTTAARFLSAAERVDRLEAVTVAEAAGRAPADAAEAAAVCRELGRVAGLDRIEAAVAAVLDAVPPPGRLRLWQVHVLLDDLADWRRRAAAAVLARPGFTTPDAAVTDWAGEHAEALRRVTDIAPTEGGADPLACATLALRRLGRVL
jgi:NAD-specific glutamate dehydrogenase